MYVVLRWQILLGLGFPCVQTSKWPQEAALISLFNLKTQLDFTGCVGVFQVYFNT